MKFYALASIFLCACIKVPDVVLVDRRTALEEQAAGSFRALEEALVEASVTPRSVPYTHRQPSDGDDAPPDPDADSERVDALLTRSCLGEASDGTLVETRKSCTGSVEASELARLIERVNRSRAQIWRFVADKKHAPLEDVRRAWRALHLGEVVCGGQVQNDDGTWSRKKC